MYDFVFIKLVERVRRMKGCLEVDHRAFWFGVGRGGEERKEKVTD